MQNMKQFVEVVRMDRWSVALLAGAVCGSAAVLLLLLRLRRVNNQREVEEKLRRARERRTGSLRRAEQEVLRYKETHQTTDSALILSLSLSELTEQLRAGLLSPEDVFYTYMEKTLAVNKNLNCCTGVLVESFEQLKTVDSNKGGLLYGVPVSIKENISYKNHDCSCGLVFNLDQPAQRDSVLVEVLKQQGAVPFVKTNLPQALLSYGCSNCIYGETVNPHNPKKTSGGSSGGEGALIGGGGSVLGIGSDIGGSIRIPASFCGICGFKPTAGRLSSQGLTSVCRGQKSVSSSPGPMGRDVDSLALCMQALLCDYMFTLDPTVPPLPFNMQIYKTSHPLRIGYVECDGYTQPSPSMLRSIREVKALLEQAGHTLVPYRPLRVADISEELVIKGLLSDGAATLLKKLQREPVAPFLKRHVTLYSLPIWFKKTLAFLLKPLSARFPRMLNSFCGVGSVQNLWKLQATIEDYIMESIEDWRSHNIDVLLCPVISPAYNSIFGGKVGSGLSYAMMYNILNCPAGVVPVSTVTEEDEEELKHYKAVTGGVGLPVAVQCVALPWQDELCLRVMKEVEQLVKQRKE